ncbi:MAG: tRNA (N6-isopentenyl adenosine(37)-C2)-methylthiotransferase MiaB [Leptospirales bacterium]|nr:tRNA (N6-isopentenyl adenosine(37)-C2)-methylthiotransferase MiaB [Leptospirales bacterium]
MPTVGEVYLETYGCQMNEYDSGVVRAILGDAGFVRGIEPREGGVILLNTCAIRENAHQKVYRRLEALAYLKRRNPRTVIGILGCMAQNLGDDLFAQGLAVDFVAGPDNYRSLPEIIARVRSGEEAHISITQLSRSETYDDIAPVVRAGCLAFVTIMRGCDNFCSFCVVPFTRGRERSRDPSSIVAEVRALQAAGVREVTLLGQNVNSYRQGDVDFTGLVRQLLDQTDIARIRFTSPHPRDFPDSLIDLMASEDRFASSIHLPLQSGSSAVLQRMRRDYSRDEFLNLVRRLRQRIPDLGLTTDVIVGFCGETDEEFGETLSLMSEIRFDMAYMFRYSQRELTSANKHMPDDVSEETKLVRLNALIELQTSISRSRGEEMVGRIFETLVEGRSKRSADEWMARTASGRVCVFPAPPGVTLQDALGKLIEVQVESASSATLRGKWVGSQVLQ